MTKERVCELSENEAFVLGKECKENGFSIYYDPYRNIDTTKGNLYKLQDSWHKGWLSTS